MKRSLYIIIVWVGLLLPALSRAQITISTSVTSDVSVTTSGDPYTVTGAGNLNVTDLNGWLDGGHSITIEPTVGDLTLSANISKTDGGDATLTLKSRSRVIASGGSIQATTGKLNVVLWAESDGGTSSGAEFSTLTTNGGHLWVGGGSSSTTWNGLTGPASSAYTDGTNNWVAVFLAGNVQTGNGDVLIEAYSSTDDAKSEISAMGSIVTIDSGTGSISLLTNKSDFRFHTNPGTLILQSMGEISIAPTTGSNWYSALEFNGSVTSGTFTASNGSASANGGGSLYGLAIANYSSTGGFCLGTYAGDGSGNMESTSNVQDIKISLAIGIAGPITVYGGDIAVNENLNTTAGNATGDVLLKASGTITQAASKSVTTNGGDVIYWADSDASGGGAISMGSASSISSGAGNISLQGTGLSSGGVGVYLVGNNNANSTVVESTSGNISINGTGAGTGSGRYGIQLSNGSTVRTTDGGNITLIGQGSLAGTLVNNEGVNLGDGSLVEIQKGDSRTLTINGTGGTGTNYNIGVNVRANSKVSMGALATGTMNVTGIGGGGSGSSGCWGILVENDGSYESLGASSIVLNGTGGSGTDNMGIKSNKFIISSCTNLIGSSTMSGNISLNADAIDLAGNGAATTVQSSGNLTICPKTATTTIGLAGGTGTLSLAASLFSTCINNGFSNITIGNATAGNITVGGAVSYNDPLTLLTAGNIAINGNLTTTTSATGVVFKAGGDISQAASKSVTTNGGNVIYWTDSDASGGGAISLGSASSIATSGGHLWMGGGSGTTTWNGLTIGDGYATGFDINGKRDGILINNGTLNSAGGDIALYGESCVVTGASDLAAGIRINDQLNPNANTVINSGTGKIVLEGVGRGSTGYFSGVELNTANTGSTVSVTSTNTTASAITIIGNASPATASGWGLLSYYNTEISATGTGGGVTITGEISSYGGKAIGFSSPNQTGTRVLANGGPIIFNAVTRGTGVSLYAIGNGMVVGQLTGSVVPTSSSNITLNIDRPMTGTLANVPDITFNTSGNMAIQPLAATTTIGIAGATGTVPLPASLFTTSFADGFSQITIGGSTQSGNINLNSVTFRDNMRLQTSGTVSVNAGQTITATGIKLQVDNTLGMGMGSQIVR